MGSLVVKLKFGKYRKVSKYYQTDSLQNIFLLFMFLITTTFVKNSHISGRILFIFLKNVLDQTRNAFNTKFSVQTSSQRIYETNFSFDVKEHNTRKIKSLFLVDL